LRVRRASRVIFLREIEAQARSIGIDCNLAGGALWPRLTLIARSV